MSPSAAAEQALPTGAQRWTIIGTLLVGAFVFSLNARGSILESQVIIQAFGLDHYKIQWITGAEGVAGLTSLFASIYLIKVFGARRVFLLGAVCLAVGALGESLARTPLELGVAGMLRSCAGFYAIPGLIMLQRLLPGRNRFAYCTYLSAGLRRPGGGRTRRRPAGVPPVLAGAVRRPRACAAWRWS